MSRWAPKPSPIPEDLRQLLLVTTAAAQAAAAVTGVLAPVLLLITWPWLWAWARAGRPLSRSALRGLAGTALVAFAIGGVDVAISARQSVAAGDFDPTLIVRHFGWLLLVVSMLLVPTWRILSEVRTGLVLNLAMLIAAAAARPTLSTWSVVFLISSWVCLLATLVRYHRAQLPATAVRSQPTAGLPRRLPIGASPSLPILAAVCCGAALFALIPAGLGGPDLSRRVAGRFHGSQSANRALSHAELGVDSLGTGNMDLNVRGSLPTTPLLRVPLDSPSLWRATVYSTYTGSSWLAPGYGNGRLLLVRGPDARLPVISADVPDSGTPNTYTVYPLDHRQVSALRAPGTPTRVVGQFRALFLTDRGVEITGAPPSYQISVDVPPRAPTDVPADSAARSGVNEWTALPQNLPARIGALARQVTAGATTRAEQVDDIDTYLRTHESYMLDAPVPGSHEDAVDDFLFRDHEGFCEQFASAAAVMLRSIGVPTRVVSGLGYGESVNGSRVFSASDAHAWIEVQYPAGWVPSDPTAGAPLVAASATGGHGITDRLNAALDRVPGGVSGVLAGMIAVGLLVSQRRRLRRRRLAPPSSELVPTSHGPLGPVLTAFERFTARGARMPRAPSETAREYVGRQGAASDLRAALSVLEQELYDATDPPEERISEAVAAFDAR